MPHIVRFSSKDDLLITADLYSVPEARGFMVLCHRSHFNRGEYRETAAKLNLLGFSCMASISVGKEVLRYRIEGARGFD